MESVVWGTWGYLMGGVVVGLGLGAVGGGFLEKVWKD